MPSCCITKKHIRRVNANAWELHPSGAKNWSSTRFLSFCPCIKDLLHNADLLFLASGIKLHLLGWFVLKKIQSTYHDVSYPYLYIFLKGFPPINCHQHYKAVKSSANSPWSVFPDATRQGILNRIWWQSTWKSEKQVIRNCDPYRW